MNNHRLLLSYHHNNQYNKECVQTKCGSQSWEEQLQCNILCTLSRDENMQCYALGTLFRLVSYALLEPFITSLRGATETSTQSTTLMTCYVIYALVIILARTSLCSFVAGFSLPRQATCRCHVQCHHQNATANRHRKRVEQRQLCPRRTWANLSLYNQRGKGGTQRLLQPIGSSGSGGGTGSTGAKSTTTTTKAETETRQAVRVSR